MGFVSYPHLILLISGQMFEVTVAHEIFWELNGPLDTPRLYAIARKTMFHLVCSGFGFLQTILAVPIGKYYLQ